MSSTAGKLVASKTKLTIYLADLTHTDIALASGTFPLGIGYVASAIKQTLEDKVDIKIFKYPSALEEAIQEKVPDVFMCSNYIWNQNLCLSFAKAIKEMSDGTLVICGGPNISMEARKQEAFLRDNPYLDFYIINEGEYAASALLDTFYNINCNIALLKRQNSPQCLTIQPDNQFFSGVAIPRLGVKDRVSETFDWNTNVNINELDDVKSPFLTHLMDEFFDNKLYPLVETNRGCPFTCTFCQQGTGYFNKVAYRDMETVLSELDYIAERMVKHSPGIARIEFADPNFCMFKRDIEITDHLRKIQEKLNWPKVIGCSTGKNQPYNVINAVEKVFPDTLVISTSMQSTNMGTLEEIKRKNIKLDAYKTIQTEIHKRGLRSMADVILGLPLETKDSHFEAIFSLIDSGVQEFTSYQAMILKSSELERESSKIKYGFTTKWRLLPRAIGQYAVNGKKTGIAEVEQIVISSNTMTFEEYLESRSLHLTTMIYHNSGVFDAVDNLLQKKSISKSTLIKTIYERVLSRNSFIDDLVAQFIHETRNELFDTEEESQKFYEQPQNLQKVRESEIGGNLLWKYLAVAFFENWDDVVDEMINALKTTTDITSDLAEDLKNFLLARVINISSEKFNQTEILHHRTRDIEELLQLPSNSYDNLTLTTDDGCFGTLEHYKKVYPNNPNGWSLMLAQLRVHSFLRRLPATSPLI